MEQAIQEDPGSKRRWIVLEERDTTRRVKKPLTGPEMRYGTTEELRESKERLLNKIFEGSIPELSGTRLIALAEAGHLTNSATVLGRKAGEFVESVDKLLEVSVEKMKENGSWMDDHAPFGEFEVAPDRRNPLLSTTRYREGEILGMRRTRS